MLAAGVDILHVERMERALAAHGQRFLRRVFTPQEVVTCAGNPSRLAARFAAKEAAGKMLGVGMRILHKDGIGWQEAEVTGDDNGQPILLLHGGAAARARALGLAQWALSLAHERDTAIAFVVGM